VRSCAPWESHRGGWGLVPSARRRLAVVSVAASLFFGPTTLIGASGAAAQPVSPPRSAHGRVVAFWTNERAAQATPRDFELDPHTRSFRPSAKPGAGGGTSSTTLGSSWTGGGEVLKTTGKVLFAMGSSYYVCSASFANDAVSGRSIILTAAHCAYDETGGAFATNWMFVPDYDSAPAPLTSTGSFCASTTLGCWTASALVVAREYTTAGGFNDQAVVHDYAFAVVGAGGKSGAAQLDATVGGQPIQFSAVGAGAETYLFGYPSAGRYKGKDLVYCRGLLGLDSYTANATYRVGYNMSSGSSGGPWFTPFNGGSGTMMSVNSYSYSGITAMNGPKLNAETQSMFVAAASATANTVVS